MNKPKTSSTSSTNTSSIDTELLIQTTRELDKKHVQNVFNLCTALGGIKIIPDLSGFMLGENEYAVIVGSKLYKKLKGVGSET